MLATWAAGLAAGASVVAFWRVVGPGFLWLAGGIVLLFGVPAAAVGGGAAAVTGAVVAAIAVAGARRWFPAGVLFASSAAAFLVSASSDGGYLLAATGTLVLGGVTSEMVLGHWYLVDPRLPRWALQRLDLAGAVGLLLDAGVLVARGALGWEAEDAVLGWAFVALSLFTLVLLVGVWFALKEPAYSGVMAATGLSYLAVLTVFGSAVVGRALIDADRTVSVG